MSERDELAELMQDNITDSLPSDARKDEIREQVETAVDVLFAAGYRKPQQVITVEELDALPEGSVVLNRKGDSAQKDHDGDWWFWGGDLPWVSEEVGLPATVLHVGSAE